MMSYGEMVVFAGNANLDLAEKICQYLEIDLGEAKVGQFSDGEIQIEIKENVRRKEVFIVQPTCSPVNNNLMELLLIIDACKRSSASRIIAVIPYFGYARQDKKVAPRSPISAKLIADLLTTAGANKVITMDLHASQIQGFFDRSVDNLYAKPVIIEDIERKFSCSEGKVAIISPDAGGAERARSFAKELKVSFGMIDKRRPKPNESQVMNIIGDVKGKKAIILDDMIDTAGTLTKGAVALKENGASQVFAYATHGIFSGSALSRIQKSPLRKVVVTDTIPLLEKARSVKKIEVLSVASLIGEAMERSFYGKSVSSLFKIKK